MADSAQSEQESAGKGHVTSPRRGRRLVVSAVAAVLLVFGLNYVLVGLPIQTRLGEDARNESVSLGVHYRYYLDVTTLVLDLRQIENAAPVDLFRVLFQSAEALHKAGRKFSWVVLARSGKPVFLMKGAAFEALGEEFGSGQNPVYLIRAMPEKLYRPDGTPAFSSWQGGWLGVLAEQMDDANEVAQQWAGGK
jgi:hypothetical protein